MVSPGELAAVSVVAFSAGAGVVGSLVKLGHARPENESLAVTTLRGVLAELRAELDYKEREVKSLRHRLDLAEQQLDAIAETPPAHLA